MLPPGDTEERGRWMGLLARAPLALLEAWRDRQAAPAYTWLRKPETGLVMVRARAGASGEKFNLGEMTITRCALRLSAGQSGVAYVQGRSKRKAEIAALADALLQSPAEHARVLQELVEPIRAQLAAESGRKRARAEATRVEFFTLAREAGE